MKKIPRGCCWRWVNFALDVSRLTRLVVFTFLYIGSFPKKISTFMYFYIVAAVVIQFELYCGYTPSMIGFYFVVCVFDSFYKICLRKRCQETETYDFKVVQMLLVIKKMSTWLIFALYFCIVDEMIRCFEITFILRGLSWRIGQVLHLILKLYVNWSTEEQRSASEIFNKI